MTHVPAPAIWLIILIVGLPQLSETVYTPSLPDIAHALRASEPMVEYTLTIYLFSFALGTLFWGNLSDKQGRKPCILGGLFIFIIGCVGCYFSNSITQLMVSRFIQAFGGSIGTVLGQAVCRDAFHGRALGKAYASVVSALSIFPAIGPVIGGFIAENAGWSSIFLFLILAAMTLSFLVTRHLPETHQAAKRKPLSILKIACSLITDRKVIGFGLIIAACNGIFFSYFAEGSFYLIKILGLTPSEYGLSFIPIAASIMLGGMMSNKLQNTHTSQTIMAYGLLIVLVSAVLFSGLALWHIYVAAFPQFWMVYMTVTTQMSTRFGICMVTSNALALALVEYKWCIGTASGLFGSFYYGLISLFTLGMGVLHNGTLLPMPLYFLGIGIFMIIIQKAMIRNSEREKAVEVF